MTIQTMLWAEPTAVLTILADTSGEISSPAGDQPATRPGKSSIRQRQRSALPPIIPAPRHRSSPPSYFCSLTPPDADNDGRLNAGRKLRAGQPDQLVHDRDGTLVCPMGADHQQGISWVQVKVFR